VGSSTLSCRHRMAATFSCGTLEQNCVSSAGAHHGTAVSAERRYGEQRKLLGIPTQASLWLFHVTTLRFWHLSGTVATQECHHKTARMCREQHVQC